MILILPSLALHRLARDRGLEQGGAGQGLLEEILSRV